MTTIKDVAKKANVSVATVSRVINNKGYVHEETKVIVNKVIKDLNYMPNLIARSLSKKESNIIGVIVPHIGSPFYGELLEGIENSAISQGYKVMLCSTQDNKEREFEYLQILNQYNLQGAIIASNFYNVEELMKLEIPIVTVDHILDERIPSITADNMTGGRLAAQKLIQAGCKHFLHLRGPSFLLTVSERTMGFVSELKKHGYKTETYDFDLLFPDSDFIYNFLKNNPQIDGIFSGSDSLGITALYILQKLGRKVPDDVQIIGFDNINFSKVTIPSLTTISQPIRYMGAQALNTLVKISNGEELPVLHQIMTVELIERNSTKT